METDWQILCIFSIFRCWDLEACFCYFFVKRIISDTKLLVVAW